MYAVVGCTDCGALRVVEGRPETVECHRCGTRRRYANLRKLATSDDPDEARQLRAALLAERQDRAGAFGELDSFAEMERRLDEAGVDDDEYLAGSGVDPDAVAEGADRATERSGSAGSSRREVVLEALGSLEAPGEADVVAYARERGVPPEYTRRALRKLVRAGAVSESDDGYRLL